MKKSISWSISLKFSVFLSIFVLVLSLAIILVSTKFVRNREKQVLFQTIQTLEHFIQSGQEEKLQNPEITKIPYFISWTIAEYDSDEIIYSNDPFIPILENTEGKTVHYRQKDYYTDGDLNIMYISQVSENEKYLFQASMNMDQDSIERFLFYLPASLLIIFLPLLLLSFFAAYTISKNTLKPISKMTKDAASISSSNLESKLKGPEKNNELDLLAFTFNELFDRLKADFEKVKAFTSNVSHELKTPIAVIQGHTNLLLRWGKNNPEQLEKSLNLISKEIKSMNSIVSNLLQLTHLENKDIKINLSEFKIIDLLNDLKEKTLSWSAETIFEFKGDLNQEIQTDWELLNQICIILIQNSIKFCMEKTCKITVTCIRKECDLQCGFQKSKKSVDCIEFLFCDNGPGISEKALPHIFERFYREDESHNRAAGGSGLGLSIAKEIVSILNGSIAAKNKNIKNILECNSNFENNKQNDKHQNRKEIESGAEFILCIPVKFLSANCLQSEL